MCRAIEHPCDIATTWSDSQYGPAHAEVLEDLARQDATDVRRIVEREEQYPRPLHLSHRLGMRYRSHALDLVGQSGTLDAFQHGMIHRPYKANDEVVVE